MEPEGFLVQQQAPPLHSTGEEPGGVTIRGPLPGQGLVWVSSPVHPSVCRAQGLTFPYTRTSKRMPKAFRSVRYSLPFSVL